MSAQSMPDAAFDRIPLMDGAAARCILQINATVRLPDGTVDLSQRLPWRVWVERSQPSGGSVYVVIWQSDENSALIPNAAGVAVGTALVSVKEVFLGIQPGQCGAVIEAINAGGVPAAATLKGLYMGWRGEVIMNGGAPNPWPKNAVVGQLFQIDMGVHP